MTILENIKAASLAARKARETAKASLLSTLIGEIETAAKSGKSVNDDDVIAVVKKFIKNIDESLVHVTRTSALVADDMRAEKEILESFLPQQLSEAELKALLQTYIAEGAKNVGDLMKRLKAEKAGLYDGGMASKLAKELA